MHFYHLVPTIIFDLFLNLTKNISLKFKNCGNWSIWDKSLRLLQNFKDSLIFVLNLLSWKYRWNMYAYVTLLQVIFTQIYMNCFVGGFSMPLNKMTVKLLFFSISMQMYSFLLKKFVVTEFVKLSDEFDSLKPKLLRKKYFLTSLGSNEPLTRWTFFPHFLSKYLRI